MQVGNDVHHTDNAATGAEADRRATSRVLNHWRNSRRNEAVPTLLDLDLSAAHEAASSWFLLKEDSDPHLSVFIQCGERAQAALSGRPQGRDPMGGGAEAHTIRALSRLRPGGRGASALSARGHLRDLRRGRGPIPEQISADRRQRQPPSRLFVRGLHLEAICQRIRRGGLGPTFAARVTTITVPGRGFD